MNSSIQTNILDTKVVSSQENTSCRHDENINRNGGYSKLPNSKSTIDNSVNNIAKPSNIMIKNRRKIANKNIQHQESVKSTSLSVNRLEFTADRPIINQSMKAMATVNLQQKLLIESTSVSQESNNNSVKNKLKKQISNNGNKKTGVNIICIPKKSSHTAKEASKSIRKDRINATVKDNGHSISNSNNINISQERKKSRILSPSEIKILRTNIRTTEICSAIPPLNKASHHNISSLDYEDDFENYESDFQECTDSDEDGESQIRDEFEAIANETAAVPIELQMQKIEKKIVTNVPIKKYIEDEHMLDSGHYELHEARRRAAKIGSMTATKNVRGIAPILERSMLYFGGNPSEIKSLPSSSADEGFDDGRSDDFSKLSPISNKINETNPKYPDEISHNKQVKLVQCHLTRGKQLLEMIKLDAVEWSLYESTPVAYEEFIRIHGKFNARQISTQTNDDNLSVEVQTEKITCRNMWTQFPIKCQIVLENNDDINLFTAELAGVGSDEINARSHPQYDILELNEFLSAAGNVILTLLESKLSQNINIITNPTDNHQLPFDDTTIKLSVANVTFLSNRPVIMIRYSDISSEILLTIHNRVDEEIQTLVNEDIDISNGCIGCQWNIFQASRPIKLFYSSYNITACRFHPTNHNIVFGGLEDGTVSLWDLGENEFYHRRVIDKNNKIPWTLRCVTFNSGGNFEEQAQSKIVSLTILSKIDANTVNDVREFMPMQLCSLDEKGGCIVWSLLKNFEGTSIINENLGQSWWGKLRLIKSHEIPINFNNGVNIKYFMGDFRDICVDSININSLYIAANINHILHIRNFGTKPKPSFFYGIDSVGGTTCIEICPFKQPFFLVGCEDGTVRLYSSKIASPLVQLKNPNSSASIRTIQWSKSKPFIIYVLDNDANIHVWDLKYSSNCPLCSITPDIYGHMISMQLSPCRTVYEMKNQYMAVGFDNGTVEVHKFNRKFYYSLRDDVSFELTIFSDYFDID